jgi:hypothetical protein
MTFRIIEKQSAVTVVEIFLEPKAVVVLAMMGLAVAMGYSARQRHIAHGSRHGWLLIPEEAEPYYPGSVVSSSSSHHNKSSLSTLKATSTAVYSTSWIEITFPSKERPCQRRRVVSFSFCYNLGVVVVVVAFCPRHRT